MAFIDFVEWNDSVNDVFAWKYAQNNNNNLSTFTQLIFMESQEAVLFSKGQILGKFRPGKHTLNTENLPLLRNFFGIHFGVKNPFTIEIWFVNKTAPLTINWRTDTMRYRDSAEETSKQQYLTQIKSKGQVFLHLTDKLPAEHENIRKILKLALDDIKYIYLVNSGESNEFELQILQSLAVLSQLCGNIQEGAHNIELESEAANLQNLVNERKLLRN